MIDAKLKELSREYELVGEPIFLSDFFKPDGKKHIFSTLKKYHKSAYQPNERIIIIHNHYDEYDIEPNAGNSLIFLQNCLQTIDISNFFVIVISSNNQIDAELHYIQEKYSTDSNAISSCILDESFEHKKTTTDSFCILPWIHLFFHTSGDVFPCCHAVTADPLGNAKVEPLDDIVHGKKFNNLRKNMINGVWSKECISCLNSEKSTGTSSRLHHNKRWEHLIDKAKQGTNSNGEIDKFDFRYLDLRFSHVCNSKCRTCSAEYSSSIQQENKIIFPEYQRIEALNIEDKKNILQQLTPNLNNPEEIYFAGGEPLLMAEHYELLKLLIANNKNTVKIRYNTNLSTDLTYKNINVLDLWNQFEDVTLGLSVDGHGEIYEYVRHGSKWSKVLENLEQIKEQSPHVKLSVTSTVSLLSAESIIELQKQWHETNFLSIDKFKIYLVKSAPDYQNKLIPGSYDLQMLLPHQKKYVEQKINEHCEWLHSLNAEKLCKDWQAVKQYMFEDDLTFCLQQKKIEHNARDRYRNENFDQLYPQFKGLFS